MKEHAWVIVEGYDAHRGGHPAKSAPVVVWIAWLLILVAVVRVDAEALGATARETRWPAIAARTQSVSRSSGAKTSA